MRYNYTCRCGYQVQIETDTKPPIAVKCYRCKESIRREGLKEGEDE